MPSDVKLSRWYKFQPVAVKLLGSAEAENRKVILKLVEEDKSARLLDLGCGDGSLTLELGKRIGTSELYGIEIVEESIQQCNAKGIKVYLSDLNKPFPVESGSLDVIQANQVIEHLYDTDGFIKEIYRVLRRGGYAIISTPNLAALPNIFSLILGWQPLDAMVSDEIAVGNPVNWGRRITTHPAHRRIFTRNALKELFQHHGFKVEKMIGVGYYPFPVWLSRIPSYLDPRHAAIVTIKARKG